MKPKLTDPKEYRIIKEVYFKDNTRVNEEIDSIEKLERMEARYRQNNKSSR